MTYPQQPPSPQPQGPQQPQGQWQPQGPWQPQQWQPAPQLTLPPDPGESPVPTALRVVLVLLFVNLGLSLLTAVLSYVLRDQLVDTQLQGMHLSKAALDDTKQIIQQTMLIRVASIAVVAVLYLWLANRLIKGKRWAYRRALWLSGAGLVGLGYLAVVVRYPLWMHVEQGAQACVLIAMLVALLRPEVRRRFRKIRY